MKLIYTCDNVNGKDVVPYDGMVDVSEIIGKRTNLFDKDNSIVYRISVPIKTQYVNKSGMNFTRSEDGGMTIVKPYGEIVKVSEIIEWKSSIRFYDDLMGIISGIRFPKDWCKEVNGNLLIDIRGTIYPCWSYENWVADKKYSSGEAKEYKPKRCSIKTVVSSIEG